MKLAYFVSHPIQYQAPLLRRIAAHPDIDLRVFFISDFSVRTYFDEGFGVSFNWDVPLLEGYEYEFLSRGGDDRKRGFFNPLICGIRDAIAEGGWDAVWFHGYAHNVLMRGIQIAASLGKPIFFRSDSNLLCTRGGILKDRFIRWLVHTASGLLWVGSANRDYYCHYGANEKQLFFVPYAVDNDFFRSKVHEAASLVAGLRVELGLASERPVVLYAGKLLRRKNPVLLLEAYAQVLRTGIQPAPYLLFVGDGEERGALERRTSELGLRSDVRVIGFKNQTELPCYFALCDLFVMPSEKEPFGLVINEVMNAGKPIIATDEVGASKDLVHEGRNGFVVSAGSVDAMASAILRALLDRSGLVRMGQESLKIIDAWSYDRSVEGIVAALLATKRRGAA